jgi:prepilin-type processing-associated H-X9-DG protein
MTKTINKKLCSGFTLVEAMVVVATIAILAAFFLPALSKAKERGWAMVCLNNTKQMTLGLQVYTGDHEDALPYNLVMNGSSMRTNLNWVNNVMTWDLSSDNTNLSTIRDAALGPYVSGSPAVYHCPSDRVLSQAQSAAGWESRIRSYSINALVGNAGSASTGGYNVNDPQYKQYFKSSQIFQPSEIFVFVDEHPNTIDDGSFVIQENNYNTPSAGFGTSFTTTPQWTDMPASYHNRSAAFSFADGHSSLHRWMNGGTIRPATPGANQPAAVSGSDQGDVQWMIAHMGSQN